MPGTRLQQHRSVACDRLPLERLRAFGYDRHSAVADPGLRDAEGGDFRLRPDSPALAVGFKPFPIPS
jgi:hypothetical protein